MYPRIAWLFLFSFCPAYLLQQQPSDRGRRQPHVERFQKEFNFYPGGKVVIHAAIPGNLKIAGWKRATVALEAEKVFYQLPANQTGGATEQFPIRIRHTPTSATIQIEGPPGSGAAVEVNSTVYVPQDKTDVTINQLKGDLAIEKINGWVEATLVEGSLDARWMQGYFSFTTGLGDISVEMAGKRWDGLGFTAFTRRGTIRIRLPVDYSAALQLETRDGQIRVQYPEQLVEGESAPLKAVAKKNARSLTATVGQGGAPIKLQTSAGDVLLSTTQNP